MNLSTSSKTRMKVGSKATKKQSAEKNASPHQLIDREAKSSDFWQQQETLNSHCVQNYEHSDLCFISLEGTFLAKKILLWCPKYAFICIAISLELQSKDFKSGWLFLITVFVVAIRPTTQLNSSARHAAHQFSYVAVHIGSAHRQCT